MSTIAENLSKLVSIKSDIASAITEKGGTVGTSFTSYAQAIRDLPTGGVPIHSILTGELITLIDSSFSGKIRDNYFTKFKLTTVSLPKAERIGSSAFYACTALTSVSLPVASYIGNAAFQYCTALTSISLPVASYIGSSAFQSCKSLTSIDLSVASYIGYAAFDGCSKLTTVNLPVASYIGYGAFQNCYSLTSIDLPAASYIGSDAFYRCSSLTSVSLPEVKVFNGIRNCSVLTSLYLPNAIKIESQYKNFLIMDCSSISIIDCPNLLYYDSMTFSCLISNCSNLTTVNLPKLRIFGYEEFSKCSKLRNITLSSRIIFQKFIGSSYFDINKYIDWEVLLAGEACCEDMGCLPTSIRSSWNSWCYYGSISMYYTNQCLSGDWRYIPYSDVYSNNNLRSVSLPYCHTIGVSAFANCSLLQSVSLPNVEFVGNHAFESCTNLYKISLPNASFIGEYAFSNIHNFTAYLDKCEYIGDYGICGGNIYFSNISSVVKINSSTVYFTQIFVPSSLYDAFCNDSQWSNFKYQIYSI